MIINIIIFHGCGTIYQNEIKGEEIKYYLNSKYVDLFGKKRVSICKKDVLNNLIDYIETELKRYLE